LRNSEICGFSGVFVAGGNLLPESHANIRRLKISSNLLISRISRDLNVRFGGIRDRVEPAAGSATSVIPPKVEVNSVH